MLKLKVILLTSALFAFCESAAITAKLGKKCSLADGACLQDLLRTVFQEIAEHGIPEMDIPKLDPFVVKHQELDILGMINFFVDEVEAKGLHNCNAGVFKADIEHLRTTINFECDLVSVEGKYKIESTPALLALIGGINIHGEGKGALVFEKVHLSLDFALEIKKLADGELHLQIIPDDTNFDFDVTEKASVSADNIYVGKQEISAVVVNIVNENWKFLVNTFGKPVVKTSLEEIYKHIQDFLSNVPAKDLISDDLTPYVKS